MGENIADVLAHSGELEADDHEKQDPLNSLLYLAVTTGPLLWACIF